MQYRLWLVVSGLMWLLGAGSALAAAPDGAVVARGLAAPVGMAHDAKGRLWVAEWGADRIVRLGKSGERAEVIEGIPQPAGLVFDAEGTLWAAVYGEGRVYAWRPETGLRVAAAGLAAPTGLFCSRETGLLVANRNAGELLAIAPDGSTRVISSGHNLPVGVARLADGAIALSCYGGSVDLVDSSGKRHSLEARDVGLTRPGVGILAAAASIFVVDNGAGTVTRLGATGKPEILAAGLGSPVGLTRAPDGRLLVASWGDGTVRALRPQPQE